MDKRIFIVIPAFNEEKAIGGVISEILTAGYSNIIVVDDCSEDNTYTVVLKFPVYLLRHAINRGQGAALQTGIDFALQNDADIIVTFDSDGQHSVSDIIKLIIPVAQGKVDAALGSRFLDNTTNTPFIRKMFLKGGVILMLLMYRLKLTDCHNGIRAFSEYSARTITITSDRMEHASEILEKIAKRKIKYAEIPVTIKYTKHSFQQGQRTRNAFNILSKTLWRKFIK